MYVCVPRKFIYKNFNFHELASEFALWHKSPECATGVYSIHQYDWAAEASSADLVRRQCPRPTARSHS